ncbi:MAG: O-antigen ligase family protein [Chloroflexota bacterium]
MTTVTVGPGRPWAVWLISLYIALLLILPVDIGLGVGGSIVTPARVALLAAALLAIVQWRTVLAALRRVPLMIWIGWAAFLGAALVTAIAWPSAASWARYASLVGEGLVVFVLVSHAASTPAALRTLIGLFAATMVGVAAVVLVLAILGLRYDHVVSGLAGTVPAADNLARYGLERQAGPFRGAAYFGIWLTAASALVLPAIVHGQRAMRWLALVGWLVLVVAALFTTGSRLAMTMVFVLPGVFFLVRGPRAVGLASLVVAAVVALGVSLFPANSVIEGSTTLRVAAIHASIDAVRMHPLFGWGLLSDQSALSGILGQRNYVDNEYLSIAVEMGLVGLTGFLLLVMSVVLTTLRAWRTPVGLALLLALMAILGMAVLISVLQATQGYAAFSVLAALGVMAALNRARSDGEAAVEIDERR